MEYCVPHGSFRRCITIYRVTVGIGKVPTSEIPRADRILPKDKRGEKWDTDMGATITTTGLTSNDVKAATHTVAGMGRTWVDQDIGTNIQRRYICTIMKSMDTAEEVGAERAFLHHHLPEDSVAGPASVPADSGVEAAPTLAVDQRRPGATSRRRF